jgi:surfactin synthase thioesterase subunit
MLAAELPGHGRQSAEPPVTSMDEVVAGLLAELSLMPDRPLVIFGHSLGSLVGLELARAVRTRTGRPPVALLVASSNSPLTGTAPGWIAEAELALPTSEYWQRIIGELGGIPDEMRNDHQLMDLLLPSLRGDLALLAGYQHHPQPALGCAVRAYAGSSDATVTEAGLAAWRRESPHDFELSRLPGGHFFLRECTDLFLARLGNDLNRLLGSLISTSPNGVAG